MAKRLKNTTVFVSTTGNPKPDNPNFLPSSPASLAMLRIVPFFSSLWSGTTVIFLPAWSLLGEYDMQATLARHHKTIFIPTARFEVSNSP